MKIVYIVLRLLVSEDGSCCDNTKILLGVFKDYDKALECAKSNNIGNVDFLGEDESPGGIELYANGYHGHFSEKISIFSAPIE